MIVAVDGPAASGKGTLAATLGRHYSLPHLDTGALYRAVARDVLARGGELADADAAEAAARAVDHATLCDPALRAPAMGEAAAAVAALPRVRAALRAYQAAFGGDGGAIIEGRDIGTVICPHASVKLFVTASLDERARRRVAEFAARGDDMALDAVRAAIAARDARDAANAASPFHMAHDARLLDTTNLTIREVFDAAVAIIDDAARALAEPAGRR